MTKTCTLDPAPTSIIKSCLDSLVEHIQLIVNSSYQQVIFPQILKNATIFPCIKKVSLDPNVLSNYRPIANLPFLSKIIEKANVSHLKLFVAVVRHI